MSVPSTFIHASRDLERFLLDARDELGHATTHQTWQSVLAVLVTFRARLNRNALPLPLRERVGVRGRATFPRHCERGEAIQEDVELCRPGLLRRFALRNDG